MESNNIQELDKKYVFHIPCYKYENDTLVSLKNENIIDNLIDLFNQNGYTSLYMTNVKGYYKSRCFDELLISIFISSDIKKNQKLPDEIFRDWFNDNNDILQQESFAYEENNRMIIEEMKD